MRADLCTVALLAMLMAANLPAHADDALAARLARLQDDVAGAASATKLLTARCAELRLADPAVVQAVLVPGAAAKPTDDIRKRLQVNAEEPLRYRRVQLTCGGHVLSVADNWYVPARLTPAMNDMLEHSDTPFGTVVQPLNFHRRIMEMATPVSRDALMAMKPGDRARLVRQTVFQVEAVLLTPQELPISLVVENYRGELLAEVK